MKPFQANLLNAAALILLGAWAYFSSDDPSITALIPPGVGLLLLVLTPGIKKENKVVSHVVVLLTVLLLVSLLVMPLPRVIQTGHSMAIARISIMALCCIIAIIVYIMSFIRARKKPSS